MVYEDTGWGGCETAPLEIKGRLAFISDAEGVGTA
jgi:hypothetical protein